MSAKNSRAPFFMAARFNGYCFNCRRMIVKGDRIRYHPDAKKAECEICAGAKKSQPERGTDAASSSDWIAEMVAEEIAALDERYTRFKKG